METDNKNNYSSWEVKAENFPKDKSIEEKIKFLLRFGILAPSGHNSQPWNFKLKANRLEILINKERFLTQHDTEGRQSYIGFGCLIESILISADYFGLTTNVKKFPSDSNSQTVAMLEFAETNGAKNDLDHLFNFIPKRSSNRGKYASKKPELALLKNICQTTFQNFKISIVENGTKDLLGKIMSEAQIEVMNNKNFREELSNFVKSNKTKSPYGMPGFTLGIPFIASLFASGLIKKINLSKSSKKQDTELLTTHTPIILVISSVGDTKEDWLNTGCILENLWLKLTKNNLYGSVLAGAIQMPKFRQKVKEITDSDMNPQAIMRCGYCETVPKHSPRFNLENLLIQK